MANVLDLFHPEIAEWFSERYGTPTKAQDAAWPVIAEGKNLLLTAPTGTGKTLAAFLWAINELVQGRWEEGAVRVLYVSPLKALNNDIQRNLVSPLTELRNRFESKGMKFPSIEVKTRSGDTPQAERRRMLSKPPSILITTPESLNLMVSAIRSREMLTGIETVILDEIHAVADSKRGTHLIVGIERLSALSGEFQRIALSATVRPVEIVAKFIAGYCWTEDRRTGSRVLQPRAVEIREIVESKEISLTPRYLPRNEQEGSGSSDESVWERIADELRTKISERSATLVFVNSRKLAEQLTHLINRDGETIAFAHHGSLSKELRLAVEERLKSGSLNAIVATSSLEMGIDIGELDAVYLVETPFSVSSAVQRLGRSGHSVGRASTGTLYASHGRDLLDAVVLSSLVNIGDIEDVYPIEGALDVLAQMLVAMIGVEPRQVDELYDFIRTAEPYRRLDRAAFDSVIEMLAGRYEETRIRELKPRIYLDEETGAVKASDGALRLIYSNGGTIPDRGYYRLALEGSNATIGELDEEFVWERRVGDTFTLGTQAWKVIGIDHQKVTVAPHGGNITTPPFWKGDGVYGPFHFSSRVAEFLERVEADFESGIDPVLPGETTLDEDTAEVLINFLMKQRIVSGAALPHRHHLVIEETNLPGTDFTQVFVHTFWGNRINYPCAVALEALLEERGWVARSQSENDCIHLSFADIESPDGLSPADGVLRCLKELADTGVHEHLRNRLESTGFFGAKFRANAGRALLLPKPGFGKRTPLWLTRLRSKRLAEQVAKLGNFPITVETWRTCLKDEFELSILDDLLAEVAAGTMAISVVRSGAPSPFTEGVVWQSMNGFVYTDDVPDQRDGTSVDDDIVRAALSGSDRPFLDPDIVRAIGGKLDRTAVGYAPAPGEELLSWIDERVLLSIPEWDKLMGAVRRDHLFDEDLPGSEIAGRLVRVTARAASQTADTDDDRLCIATLDSVARLLACVDSKPPEIEIESLVDSETDIQERLESARRRIRQRHGDLTLDDFVMQWLASRPTAAPDDIRLTFSILGLDSREAIESLVEDERVIRGRLFEDDQDEHCIEAGNLERVLRSMRRRSRRSFQPVSSELLPLFYASWQGIAENPPGNTDGQTTEGIGLSPGRVGHTLAQLEGYPAAAVAWEEFILPSRCKPYSAQALDSLLSTTDVRWLGCGERRLSFCPDDNVDLYLATTPPSEADLTLLKLLFPDPRGTYDFFTLHERSSLSTADLTNELWRLAWLGYIGSDNFDVVRRGAGNGFTASGPADEKKTDRTPGAGNSPHSYPGGYTAGARRRRKSRAEWSSSRPIAGSWYRCILPESGDAVEEDELNRERVRVLIDRYGIIFRGLLERELPPLSWSKLFRTMRLMELSGEIAGGYFFNGIPGIQFATREAVRMLTDGLPVGATYWLNATDPASICGLPTPDLRPGHPERVASSYLVYEGEKPVMIVRRNGESVEYLTDHRTPEQLLLFRNFLDRGFNPSQTIRLMEIDKKPAVECDNLEVFLEFGFKKEYKSVNLWKY
jgi:ATP-dependent helicase Lhr and Lhr-like helicase